MPYKPIEKEKLEELEFNLPDDYIKLTCPSCSSDIPANDINIHDKIAKCGQCDVIFPFHQKKENTLALAPVQQEILRPEGIDIFRFRDEMDITVRKNFNFIMSMLLLISLFTGGVLVGEGADRGINVSILIGLIIFAVSAVYLYLYAYRQTIHLNINKRFLTIKHKPKYTSEKTYAVQDIDQIYTKTVDYYGLCIFMITNGDGQKHTRLISGIKTSSKAKYLEQEIEKYLGIVDRPVPEENVN